MPINTTEIITDQITDQLAIKMVKVEGGTFMMGSEEDSREQPIHEVKVPDFYLGQFPITNAQFLPFLQEKGNQKEDGREWVNLQGSNEGVKCGIIKNKEGFKCIESLKDHPMIYVNWFGARAYCKWLSQKSGKPYRLPSEAEWEYAARGGLNSYNYSYAGSNKVEEVAWFGENSHRESKAVGLKLPNELELYDMSGNVWEWCADHWHENYKGAPADGSAWIDKGKNDERVVRGGSWFVNLNDYRVSFRGWCYGSYQNLDSGFRLSRS